MKRYSIFKCALFMMTLLSLLGACSDNSETVLLGSDDQLRFSSSETSKKFTVCATGEWKITTDAPWLSFSKRSGEGDGQTREQIVVTAARNTSSARQASFHLSAGGKTLVVNCEQEEGRPFTFGAIGLSASLQVGTSVAGIMLNIPYEYGYKGMKLTLHTAFSGEGSEGLTAEDQSFTLDTDKGTLSVPLGGKPVKSGSLVITVSTDQAEIAPVVLNTTVNDRIILEQHFDLCIYGGDFVAGKPGNMPVWVKDENGKNIPPTPLGELQPRTPNHDGSNDLFSTMAHSYLVSKGLDSWEGTKVYERPGYVKIGTGSAVGKIATPSFAVLGTENVDVVVSLKVAEWPDEQGGKLVISVEGSGTASLSTYAYLHKKAKSGSEWEEVKFTIQGASGNTRLVFTTKGNKRFAIDDLIVSVK